MVALTCEKCGMITVKEGGSMECECGDVQVKSTNYEDFKAQLLQDPTVRQEYESLKTKQEEIREEVARQLYYWLTRPYRNEDNYNETTWEAISERDRNYYREHYADVLLKDLHSQGVVIKVDRPHDSDCAVHNEPAYPNGPCDCVVLPVGCVAVEPLIKESDVHKDTILP